MSMTDYATKADLEALRSDIVNALRGAPERDQYYTAHAALMNHAADILSSPPKPEMELPTMEDWSVLHNHGSYMDISRRDRFMRLWEMVVSGKAEIVVKKP